MTNGREPSKTPVPDSGGESERRKWTHKRAQFDSAINTARLLGVVQNLAVGNMEASEALRIILEVNSATDQAQYVAEMLAMKKEFRDLARLDYIPEIAKFIRDGSRLVPSLTEGLASQMLMAMGHAAQNDAYLETVSSAVSTLLSDLDHPLMTDARNYLRLLWDQMEATRKLKQTEARYTGQPVVDPPLRMPADERRSSGSIAMPRARRPLPVEVSSLPVPQEAPAPVEEKTPSVTAAVKRPSVPGLRQATLIGTGEVRPSSPSILRHRVADAVESASKIPLLQPEPSGPIQSAPRSDATEIASLSDDFEEITKTREVLKPEITAPIPIAEEVAADTGPIGIKLNVEKKPERREPAIEEFKLPTTGVPRWAVATVFITALAGAGVVVALITEPEHKSTAPASSTSLTPKSKDGTPSASAKLKIAKPNLPPSAPTSLTPATPSQLPSRLAPSTMSASPKAQEPVALAPQQPKSTHVAPVIQAPAQRQTSVTKSVPQPPTPAKKLPERSTEPTPKNNSSQVVTSPEVSRTLSPLDRIVAELRLISPDPVGIEDKARELARIIARSKRKEATQIIENLGPPIAVDPLGRDPNLEESLQVFAVSVLGRVATDDDDNRAVDALLMLGEWVKNGGKGKQKALSALQTLGHESIIKTSAPRLRALKTAQAQAD